MTRRSLELTLVTLTALAGAVALKSAFVDWAFAPLVVISAIGAAAVSWFAHRSNVPAPLAIVVSIVAYLLLGTILTYGMPWKLAAFASDNITSWRRILTIAAPVDAQSTLVAVPLATAWLGSMIGAELVQRTTRTSLPLVGPLVSVALSILFGLDSKGISTSIGIIFLVLGLVFLAVRSSGTWLYATDRKAAGRSSRLLMAVATVAIVAIVAPMVTPSLPIVNARDRFTFRDEVEPPFDLRRLPSPLAELKAYLPTAEQTEAGDLGDLLFTVSGDEVDRFRLSVLDDYNGIVWLIARNADGADFIRAGSQFPTPDGIDQGPEVDHRVEIIELRESWLPTGGTAVRLDITSDVQVDGVEPVELIRLDRVTGNLIMRPRLTTVTGLTYDVGSIPAHSTDDLEQELAGVAVVPDGRNARLPELPPTIARRAQEISAGADSPFGQIRAIESFLADAVYDAEATPGHTVAQMTSFVERDPMVGFDEQYASAMAMMLRSIGIPSRVVVGFVPTEEARSALAAGDTWDVYENDIETWVEVPFDEVGWVAFEAGPLDSQSEEVDEGQTEVQAENLSANPPPPTTSTTSTTVPEAIEEEEELSDDEEEPEASSGVPTLVLALGVAAGVPLLLLGLFALVVLMLKRLRRSRRKKAATPSDRILGAYNELIDRSHDIGIDIPAGATARQSIRSATNDDVDDITSRSGSLATLVDQAGFAPIAPDADAVDNAWDHSDALVDRLSADKSLAHRLRAQLSLASLRSSRRGGAS